MNIEVQKFKGILNSFKVLKSIALIQSLGGVIGFGYFIHKFAPQIITGEFPAIACIIVFVMLALFAFTAFASWKYWRTGTDRNGLWRIMLVFQLPAFCISGTGYEFYSAFKVPFGYIDGTLTVNAAVSSNAAFLWQAEAPFTLTVNLAALILLVVLVKIEWFDKKKLIQS